jgi:hypothetical protein
MERTTIADFLRPRSEKETVRDSSAAKKKEKQRTRVLCSPWLVPSPRYFAKLDEAGKELGPECQALILTVH